MRANRSGFWTHKLFAAELINKFTMPCSTKVRSLSPNIEVWEVSGRFLKSDPYTETRPEKK